MVQQGAAQPEHGLVVGMGCREVKENPAYRAALALSSRAQARASSKVATFALRGRNVSWAVSKKPSMVRNMEEVSIQQARIHPSQDPASSRRRRSYTAEWK
jgi:hypothetical protein